MKRLLSIDDNGQSPENILNLLREHGYAAHEVTEELPRRDLACVHTMVRNAPIVLYGVDRNGIFTLSEGKGLAGMGLKPGEIVGRSAFDVYRDNPEGLKNFRRALTCESFTVPVHIGTHIYDAYHEPVYGDNGEYAGTFGVLVDVTERTQTEEALRQANLIIENSPAVLIRWRATEEWPVEMVSGNVTRFGYSPEDLLSGAVPFSSLVYPEDLERVAAEVAQYTSRGEERFRREYRIVTREGEVRWVDDHTVIEYDADGRVTHYQGILMDVTDRKQTENVISARMRLLEFATTHTLKELLQATLDEAEKLTGSSIGFYHYLEADQKTLSLQNWSTRTKREFCKAQGQGLHYDVSSAGVWVDCIHERRPVIHNDYASLPHRKGLPPGHAPVIRQLVVPVFRGEKIEAIFGVGNKIGDYTAQDVETVSLLADLAWEILGRKRSEKALRESEEKFRVLAETAPAAILLHQGETFIYVNPATSRISGFSEAELLEMNFWDLCHEEYRDILRCRGLARLMGEPAQFQYEHKFVTKNGEEKWAMVSAGKIEYQGKPTIIATLLDITETKRTEERMQAALAEKVVLLKEVHHRVKNNMQIISSLLDLQSDYIHEEESRRYIRESKNRINSMALVHEQLYKSANLSYIDFASYVEELVTSIRCSWVGDPDRVQVKLDIGNIELGIDEAIPCGLIVNELVSNSLKHAFPDNRQGEILIRCAEENEGRIRLSVSDTGVGLPPGVDFLNTETLGLQIVHLLTRQLRGTIEIQGGHGVAFTMRFPMKA